MGNSRQLRRSINSAALIASMDYERAKQFMSTVLRTHRYRSVAPDSRPFVGLNDRLDPMNTNYQAIEHVISRMKNDYDWSHSFIRECYFTTSHCMCEFIDDTGESRLGDADGRQHVRLIVASAGNPANCGIEFLFRGVTVFSIQKLSELSLAYEFDPHSGHSVRFTGVNTDGECWINAESVMVRFLGRSYLGIDLLLGHEFPTEVAHDAVAVEACWRQCGNCSNAWAENPNVEFSRCPDCGELTKLKTPRSD